MYVIRKKNTPYVGLEPSTRKHAWLTIQEANHSATYYEHKAYKSA